MVPTESLPVVLVSAGSEADAAAFITELIDNDVTEEVEGAAAGGARVWRLLNKYYSALVRVRPHVSAPAGASGTATSPAPAPAGASGTATSPAPAPAGASGTATSPAPAPAGASGTATSPAPAPAVASGTATSPAPPCDAFVVYLAAHECTVETLSRRVRECGGGAGVRLVVCEAAAAPPALARAAAAHGAELVPLREEPAEGEGEGDEEGAPFRDEWGVGRARAALHAHAWRGLERRDRDAPAPAPAPAPDSGELELGDSSSDNEHLSDEEEDEDEESMLRRAEQFATLLDALPAARGAGAGRAQSGAWEAERDERLRRAEALVGAFCRALGPQ